MPELRFGWLTACASGLPNRTLKTRKAQAWGWHPKSITDRCKVRRLRHPHAGADASPRPGAEGLERVERTEGLEGQGRPGAADPVGAGERTAGGSARRRKRLEAWTMWRGYEPLREGRNA